MSNKSKIRNPRNWERWKTAGALEGIDAARARAVDDNFRRQGQATLDNPDTTVLSVTPTDIHASKYSRDGETFETQAERITESHEKAHETNVALSVTPKTVTVPEAARALGVHPTTVRRRLARGTYEGAQEGTTWTITDFAILEAVALYNQANAL